MVYKFSFLGDCAKKIVFFTFFIFVFCFLPKAQNNSNNYQYEVVKMDSTFDKDADLTIETYLDVLKKEKDKKMSQVIGTSKEVLTSYFPVSPLSNLLVDMLYEWGNRYLEEKKLPKADMAMLNFGGIRAALPQGKITVGDIYQIAPFDNTVAFVYVKGSELKKVFDAFTEKKNAPMANVQTTYLSGKVYAFTIGGIPLNKEKVYTIVTINFLALGGDGFLSGIHFEKVIYIDQLLRDIFIEEIRKKTVQGFEIESTIGNRVMIVISN
jgi:2',3'-cyclic-nucleotide 2'-phosphodiesterase (5'-nucleotidase family)